MPDFMSMRISNPAAFNASAGVALATAAEALMSALRQYQKTSDLTAAWRGQSSTSHTDRIDKIADAATRVIQAIAQARSIAQAGGTQLQAYKTTNDAIVASAMGQGYLVMPTGTVQPGPPHYAAATGPHGPALMAMFRTIAALYTGQIQGTVAGATASDAQIAATIATIAIEFFADLLRDKDKPSDASVSLPTPVTTPPLTIAPPTDTRFDPPPLPPLGVNDDLADLGGTQLAGAGGPGGAMGGIGSLGGAGGLNGLGGVGGAGLSGGLSGGGPGGIAGGAGAGAAGGMLAGGAGAAGMGMMGAGAGAGAGGAAGGRTGAAGVGMMGSGGGGAGTGTGAGGRGGAGGAAGMGPMMGQGAASNGDRRNSSDTWLREDQDPFDPGDAPDGVLS